MSSSETREEALRLRSRAVLGFDLHHVEAEAAVRQLEHARQPQRRHDLVDVAAVHDHRPRLGMRWRLISSCRYTLFLHLRIESGIVDDRHAERFGAAHELVV